MPKLNVAQQSGEITVHDGATPRTYRVTDGHITVDAADVAFVLAHVDGATEAKPASTAKEK